MLREHLLVKTEPVAKSENTVLFSDYRVTVLFDRLFRIEKNLNGEFSDEATQSVWYRNMPAVSFETKEGDGYIEIVTDRVTLHLEAELENSYVLIDGKKRRSITTETLWERREHLTVITVSTILTISAASSLIQAFAQEAE